MRASTALCRQLMHLLAERGYDAAAGRHLVLIKHIEVLDQRVIGLAVLLRVFGMADPDAEQEPARKRLLDAVI